MEFYSKNNTLNTYKKSFNSQRDGILPGNENQKHRLDGVSIPNGMEFYDGLFLAPPLRCRVSIPNGMEFYLAAELVRDGAKLFQFPTGWNSTKDREADPYFGRNQFQFPTGWNSTVTRAKNTIFRRVSIPNGMEFYDDVPDDPEEIPGFNSQRDGILPRSALFSAPLSIVSIPNGMEFYGLERRQIRFEQRFQFPTGWNSTARILPFF